MIPKNSNSIRYSDISNRIRLICKAIKNPEFESHTKQGCSTSILNLTADEESVLPSYPALQIPILTFWKTLREEYVHRECARSKVIAVTEHVRYFAVHFAPEFEDAAPVPIPENRNRSFCGDPRRTIAVPPEVALLQHFRGWHNTKVHSAQQIISEGSVARVERRLLDRSAQSFSLQLLFAFNQIKILLNQQ